MCTTYSQSTTGSRRPTSWRNPSSIIIIITNTVVAKPGKCPFFPTDCGLINPPVSVCPYRSTTSTLVFFIPRHSVLHQCISLLPFFDVVVSDDDSNFDVWIASPNNNFSDSTTNTTMTTDFLDLPHNNNDTSYSGPRRTGTEV